MTRNRVHFFGKFLLSVVASVVLSNAHGQATKGVHGDLLKKVLAESAKGKCPEALMSPMLRGTCEQQMPGMGAAIAQKGAIVSTEFMGTQPTPMGPAEVYRVKFDAGTMMWMISTGTDGKILVLWSGG